MSVPSTPHHRVLTLLALLAGGAPGLAFADDLQAVRIEGVSERALTDATGMQHGTVRVVSAVDVDGEPVEVALASDAVMAGALKKGAKGVLWLGKRGSGPVQARGFFAESAVAAGPEVRAVQDGVTVCLGSRDGKGYASCKGETEVFLWHGAKDGPTGRAVWMKHRGRKDTIVVKPGLERCHAVDVGMADGMFDAPARLCDGLPDTPFDKPELRAPDAEGMGQIPEVTIESVADDHLVVVTLRSEARFLDAPEPVRRRWKVPAAKLSSAGVEAGWKGRLVLNWKDGGRLLAALGPTHTLVDTSSPAMGEPIIGRATAVETVPYTGEAGKELPAPYEVLSHLTLQPDDAERPAQTVDLKGGKYNSRIAVGTRVAVLPVHGVPVILYIEDGDWSVAADLKDADCFITTAVVQHRGDPDDGWVLAALRALRDGPLAVHDDVRAYRRIAPPIVAALAGHPNADLVWQHLYDAYLVPAASLARTGRPGPAHALYREMVHILQLGLSGPDRIARCSDTPPSPRPSS